MSAKLSDEFSILIGDEPQTGPPGSTWLTKAMCNLKGDLSFFVDTEDQIYAASATDCSESGGGSNPVLTLTFTIAGLGSLAVDLRRGFVGANNIIHIVDFRKINGFYGHFRIQFWNGFQKVRSMGWRLPN